MSDLKVGMTSDASQVLRSLTQLNQGIEKLTQATAKSNKETERAAKWFNSLTGQVTIGGLRQLGASITRFLLSPLRLVTSSISSLIALFRRFQNAAIDAFKSNAMQRFMLMRQGLSGAQINQIMGAMDSPGQSMSQFAAIQQMTGASPAMAAQLSAIAANVGAARGMDPQNVAQLLAQLMTGQLGGVASLGISERDVQTEQARRLRGVTDPGQIQTIMRGIGIDLIRYLQQRDAGMAAEQRKLNPMAQLIDPFAPAMRRFGEFFLSAQQQFYGQFAPAANRAAGVLANNRIGTVGSGVIELFQSGKLAQILAETFKNDTLIQSIKELFMSAGNVLIELLKAGTQVVLDTIASRLSPTMQDFTGLRPSGMRMGARFAGVRRAAAGFISDVGDAISGANQFAVNAANAAATIIEEAPAAAQRASARAAQNRSNFLLENLAIHTIQRRTAPAPVMP